MGFPLWTYPIVEAAAASFGCRVPEPWDRNGCRVWLDYWGAWFAWAPKNGIARWRRTYSRPRPPLGPRPAFLDAEWDAPFIP